MATSEEESRKLLCPCGKHHGTFTAEGLGIKCRRCKETTVVPYRIRDLEQAKAFLQRRRGKGRGPSV